MGTSASNGGPSGTSSLLPSWYPSINPPSSSSNPNDENDNTEQDSNSATPLPVDQYDVVTPLPVSTENWSNAKGAFTRYTKSTAGSNIRKAARSYVRTLGGSRAATKSASTGIAVGGRFGSFLSSVAAQGLAPTLTTLGLTAFIGSSSEEILARIADTIAPNGSTNDEAIARDAILSTLDAIYTKIIEAGSDITTLESLSPEMIKDAVIGYVSIYIFKKWVYELGIAVEKNSITEQQAITLEAEIKDFIVAEVQSAMADKTIRDFDLNSTSNQQIIETIFQTAYSTLQ